MREGNDDQRGAVGGGRGVSGFRDVFLASLPTLMDSRRSSHATTKHYRGGAKSTVSDSFAHSLKGGYSGFGRLS